MVFEIASTIEQSLTTVKLNYMGLPNWALIQHIYILYYTWDGLSLTTLKLTWVYLIGHSFSILYFRWLIINRIEAYMGVPNWAIIKHIILQMTLLIEQSLSPWYLRWPCWSSNHYASYTWDCLLAYAIIEHIIEQYWVIFHKGGGNYWLLKKYILRGGGEQIT